jgi:RsiW-degrading membrane proteinase PrsW (M82 family)
MILWIALNLAISALPALAFAGWAAGRRTVPFRNLYKAFIAGLLAVFPALAAMLLVSAALSRVGGLGELGRDALQAFIVAGLLEELAKLAPVAWAAAMLNETGGEDAGRSRRRSAAAGAPGRRHPTAPGGLGGRHPTASGAVDGDRRARVVVAAVAGLGFAFMENAFYVIGSSSLLLARAVLAVPLHAATAAFLGLGLATAGRHQYTRPADGPAGGDGRLSSEHSAHAPRRDTHPSQSRHLRMLPMMALAAGTHGLYDLAVTRAAAVAPVVVIAAVALALALARRHERETPAAE